MVACLSGTLNAGCASWSSVPHSSPPSRGMAVQVWQSDTFFVMEEARVLGDSLAGRLRTRDDSPGAAIAIPVSAADSVRTRQLDVGKTFLVAAGMGVAAITALWFLISGAEPAAT